MNTGTSSIFERSGLVVAHPDDEALWFSSILLKVDAIAMCYGGTSYKSPLGDARRKAIDNYPLDNILNLDIQESGTFEAVDWMKAKQTQFGLEIENPVVRARYESGFVELCERLRPLLSEWKNVFTHNPWGEYGHPDHVQVYRAVKTLQAEFEYNIWYSNCCANRSVRIALETLSELNGDCEVFRANHELASQLEKLYRECAAWTWYDDFTLFDEDVFIKDVDAKMEERVYGKMRLNMLSLDLPLVPPKPEPKRQRGWIEKIHHKISGLSAKF